MEIEFSQGVGVEFGEPDVAMGIECDIVGGAWQRERLVCVAGIGYG